MRGGRERTKIEHSSKAGANRGCAPRPSINAALPSPNRDRMIRSQRREGDFEHR